MEQKVVLITGCSLGIGLSLAVHLASNRSNAYKGLPFNDVYCASKFAVEGACESLAILLQHINIHVSLIECGPVNTDFLMNLKRTEASDEALEVDAHTCSLYDQYLQHCQAVYQKAAQDTEDITQVLPPASECTVYGGKRSPDSISQIVH